MTFKHFILQHVTAYWPCVFRGGVETWPALALWQNETLLAETLRTTKIMTSLSSNGQVVKSF